MLSQRLSPVTYRGCFDGWLSGMVKYNYEGCLTQEYAGQKVEWCFCKGTDDKTKSPCNGASREALAKISPAPMNEKFAKSGGDDASFYLQSNDFSFGEKERAPSEVQYQGTHFQHFVR